MVSVGILGYGELGQAIANLYVKKPFRVLIKDKDSGSELNGISVLNVCVPYNDKFLDTINETINNYKPLITIIHSTVLPGTTKRLQTLQPSRFVVHSPIRGNHPELAAAVKTFVKYIGSDTEEGYNLVASHFKVLGLQTERLKNSYSTELAKLLCTSYYGICIAWHNLAKELCDDFKQDYNEVVTKWNYSYNKGYSEMKVNNVIRPVLYPPGDKIGGHCIIPNAELLNCLTDSSLIKEILRFK